MTLAKIFTGNNEDFFIDFLNSEILFLNFLQTFNVNVRRGLIADEQLNGGGLH